MILKDLVMVALPVGNVYIYDQDEIQIMVVKASDISGIEEEFLDKEVLSIAPSFTLYGDRNVGCLIVKIKFVGLSKKQD